MCLVKKMRTEDKVYQVAVIGGGAFRYAGGELRPRGGRHPSFCWNRMTGPERSCFPPATENVTIPMKNRGISFYREMTLLL